MPVEGKKMSQSLYTAASGMVAQQNKIDTLANNIANVNTHGFKRNRVDFQDTIYQTMRNPADPESGENLLRGTGVLTGATTQSMLQGPMMETGRNLDFTLTNNGFFAVQDANGNVRYTRDGSFHTSELNGVNYLVTANGQFVLNQNQEPITSPVTFDQAEVGINGEITVDGQFLDAIGFFDFANPAGLEAAGSRTWQVGPASGAAEFAVDSEIRQGYLEGSNVDLAEELTQLIEAQRAYAFLSRAITTTDDMKATANDLRR